MLTFKSLPKKEREYNISDLPVNSIIYCPDSRNSYLICGCASKGYFCINQQTDLSCFLEFQVFTNKCYTGTTHA